MPFRTAYKIVGQLVAECMEKHTVLEDLPLSRYKEIHELFDTDLFEAISLETCVETRISQGGTGRDSVMMQIAFVRNAAK